MKENRFLSTNRGVENNTEQINLNLGEEWLNVESKFKGIEEQDKENKNQDKTLKAKLVLKSASNKILSVLKKFAIRTGISLAVLTGYVALDLHKQLPFSEKDKAQKEIETNGIPNDQRFSAYKPGISELIYRSITPFGYQESVDSFGIAPQFFKKLGKLGVPNIGMVQDVSANILFGRENRAEILDSLNKRFQEECKEKYNVFNKKHRITEIGFENFLKNSPNELIVEFQHLYDGITDKYNKIAHEKVFADISDGRINVPKDSPSREDAWRIYLGLPQQNHTFSVSDFKPNKGKDDKYYFKINNFWRSFQQQAITYSEIFNMRHTESNSEYESSLYKDMGEMLSINNLKGKIDFVKKYGGQKRKVHFLATISLKEGEKMGDVMQDQIMGNYTFGIGEDKDGAYVYYYDKWDLASKFAENPILKGVGNPYEIYDRLYYDPKTFEIIDQTSIRNN